ncbi:helix-turn-helix transcriptional regulator [Flavobacteriaceae bacterium]|nr:helix-turn-helix transcriptional regulator [Flavobacteriaceae bacterium]
MYKNRSKCPISKGLDLIGDQWSLLILRDVIFYDKHSYSAFLGGEEGIATNVLSQRLKKLTDTGILYKFNKKYQLSPKGLELIPVLIHLLRWSFDYSSQTEISSEMRQALNDPDGFEAKMRRKFYARMGS